MAAAGRPLPSFEFVPYLLVGLGLDYDALVSFVSTRIGPISIEELLSHLLAHEARLQHHEANLSLFSPQETTANFSTCSSNNGRGRNSHSCNNGTRVREGRYTPNRLGLKT